METHIFHVFPKFFTLFFYPEPHFNFPLSRVGVSGGGSFIICMGGVWQRGGVGGNMWDKVGRRVFLRIGGGGVGGGFGGGT